jgi:hypothetical protein
MSAGDRISVSVPMSFSVPAPQRADSAFSSSRGDGMNKLTTLVPTGLAGATTAVAGAPWYWVTITPLVVFLVVWAAGMIWREWFARKPEDVRRDILELEALTRSGRLARSLPGGRARNRKDGKDGKARP